MANSLSYITARYSDTNLKFWVSKPIWPSFSTKKVNPPTGHPWRWLQPPWPLCCVACGSTVCGRTFKASGTSCRKTLQQRRHCQPCGVDWRHTVHIDAVGQTSSTKSSDARHFVNQNHVNTCTHVIQKVCNQKWPSCTHKVIAILVHRQLISLSLSGLLLQQLYSTIS